MADTGFHGPVDTAVISAGIVFPTYVYYSDAVYAYGTSSADKQKYYTFTLGVPSGATINGIELTALANADGVTFNGDIGQLSFSLSKNGGSSYTAEKTVTMDVQAGSTVQTFGGATDLWGTTWTDTDLNNTNFAVSMHTGPTWTGGCSYINVDYVFVKVYYTEGGGGGGSVASIVVTTMRTMTGVGL
jgi:hypothetical protein